MEGELHQKQKGVLALRYDENNIYILVLIRGSIWSEVRFHHIRQDSLTDSLEVTFVDSLLYSKDGMTERMEAIRHANGKDWWIITHERNNNRFIKLLVDENGITVADTQAIGNDHNLIFSAYYGESEFSYATNQFATITQKGLIDLFHFDRCTGELSNHRSINEAQIDDNVYYGLEFSPNGKLLYVGKDSLKQVNVYSYEYLQQFEVDAPDITASEKTIWVGTNTNAGFGHLKLGPDGKIYAVHWAIGDTIRHLGVIHSPDSVGAACNFQPYSLDLSPYNSTLGLPNIPNYRAGKLASMDAETGPDQQICLGDSSLIGISDTSGGKMEWSWWPDTGLSDPNISRPLASPSTTTTYYLTATDTTVSAACATTLDSVTVYRAWTAWNTYSQCRIGFNNLLWRKPFAGSA